ncbi:hypothetical protein [Deinococcus roseus]|uniref:Ribbon-helix-helix protein CopG domain-containing protein n=1 Tax=Deinococcus roseus TaxID=392414 RepID=A0ABQ2DAE6_9DEIO|nr:hypothetical protein [Deinococcus roseus]GGJ49977.1 hypothetical protein GCM10008938_39910 [Deinococcus roseus]
MTTSQNQPSQNQTQEQKTLQQPTDVVVQLEKVEYELIAHTAERQGLTVSAMLRELAIDELRDRIKGGRLPITEDYPPNLKQTAQILGATSKDLAHNILHQPNKKAEDKSQE